MQTYYNTLFSYKDGKLYWKIARSNCIQIGDEAGTPTGNGYLKVSIDGKYFKVHRIIWTMHYGEIPEGLLIDHADGNGNNNLVSNLRLATAQENQRNRQTNANKRFKGVSFDKARNKWKASIRVDNVSYHIGRFETEKEARDAYCEVAKEIHGVFFKENEVC